MKNNQMKNIKNIIKRNERLIKVNHCWKKQKEVKEMANYYKEK